MLFRSLPVKCSNNSGDLFGTFAAHSGLLVVRDVTDTECWAQNSSTQGRVFADRFLTNKDRKSSEKLLRVWLCFLIPFLSIGSVMLLRLGFPLSLTVRSCFVEMSLPRMANPSF